MKRPNRVNYLSAVVFRGRLAMTGFEQPHRLALSGKNLASLSFSAGIITGAEHVTTIKCWSGTGQTAALS